MTFLHRLLILTSCALSTAAPINILQAQESYSELLFPDWPGERFKLEIFPLMGFRSRVSHIAEQRVDTVSSEFGLGTRLRGLPIWGSNPGIRMQPYGLYTWGHRSERQDGPLAKYSESSAYNRQWLGLQTRYYHSAFRYTLDVSQGGIFYDRAFSDVKGFQIGHDFGLLILPWLSSHYTVRDITIFESKKSEPTIQEWDHWLHVRWFWSFLDFYIDAGPGLSHLTLHELGPDGDRRKLGSGQTSYFRSLASMHFFWKLGAHASIKYILAAAEEVADGVVYDQLPNQTLNEPTLLNTLPAGSQESIFFVGLRDLFAGFGLGWQYRILVLNYQDDRQREEYRDQGWVLAYETPM